MANLQNNLLIEVEEYIGEQLQDYTNEQVIRKVEQKYGRWMVPFATEKLAEFQFEDTRWQRKINDGLEEAS